MPEALPFEDSTLRFLGFWCFCFVASWCSEAWAVGPGSRALPVCYLGK